MSTELPFLDRAPEMRRIRRILDAKSPQLGVIYGRRRCGKSRLLKEAVGERAVYYLADTRETPLQIRSIAAEVAKQIPGFDDAEYGSWDALLSTLNARAPQGLTLIIDEFPYLVGLYPPLPSVVQKWFDSGPAFSAILCGSSQRMMQGLVLDSTAPLYGRATEIVKIRPLPAGWIETALGVSGTDAVEAYAVWGGVPRYLELARSYGSLKEAILDLVLDHNGVLHDEPQRLLLDDMRSAAQPHSLLSLIAGGCHRLSEIAARLEKSASSLSRPLNALIELGYIRRDIPYSESIKSTKRSLYVVNDPFLEFWYRFVLPCRSMLERGHASDVYGEVLRGFTQHVASIWEQLARESTSYLEITGKRWKPGERFWGTGKDGTAMEIDVVAESVDGTSLLLGEAKWEARTNLPAVLDRLKRLSGMLPFAHPVDVHVACWARQQSASRPEGLSVIGPVEVMAAIR